MQLTVQLQALRSTRSFADQIDGTQVYNEHKHNRPNDAHQSPSPLDHPSDAYVFGDPFRVGWLPVVVVRLDRVVGSDEVLQERVVDETQTDRRRVVGLVVVEGDRTHLVGVVVVVELRGHHVAVRVLVATSCHRVQQEVVYT